MLTGQRRSAALLWNGPVDAAANVGAEVKVDSGGGAPMFGRRGEEDEVKGDEGENEKDPSALFTR